jgi:hypothetical protein
VALPVADSVQSPYTWEVAFAEAEVAAIDTECSNSLSITTD